MSTRSAIIEKIADGRFRGIYCHFDGYLEGVGHTLRDHYQDAAKVSALIDLGSLSFLSERVSPIGAHSFDSPEEGTTVAYHRDRGEEIDGPHFGSTSKEVADQIGHNGEVYLFIDGAWTHNGTKIA